MYKHAAEDNSAACFIGQSVQERLLVEKPADLMRY